MHLINSALLSESRTIFKEYEDSFDETDMEKDFECFTSIKQQRGEGMDYQYTQDITHWKLN